MNQKFKILETINQEYYRVKEIHGTKAIDKVERIVYPLLPSNDKELLELFDFLVSTGESKYFWLVTKWIKRKGLYKLQYMQYYERWLCRHIDRWGLCDVFCYRLLNPIVEKYPQLFEKVIEWAASSKTLVRRAAPVSFIHSGRSFHVNVGIKKVLLVAKS